MMGVGPGNQAFVFAVESIIAVLEQEIAVFGEKTAIFRFNNRNGAWLKNMQAKVVIGYKLSIDERAMHVAIIYVQLLIVSGEL